MDWNDLRFFLGAARAGSLAAAARTLGVEHTTVGRRLAALERSLGAPLVLRRTDGLRLTPLGEKLVPLAEDVERAATALEERMTGQRVPVRLAVPSGFAALFAPAWPALYEEHPDIALEVVSGARTVDLGRGAADLAIRVGPVGDPDLVTRKLCEVGWSLYAAPSYLAQRPMTGLDLAGHLLVGYERGLSAAPAARWLETHGAGATVVFRSREITDMLAAAVAGVGIALLPCALADGHLKRLARAVLLSSPMHLAYRAEVRGSRELSAVVRFLVAAARTQADRLSGNARTPRPS